MMWSGLLKNKSIKYIILFFAGPIGLISIVQFTDSATNIYSKITAAFSPKLEVFKPIFNRNISKDSVNIIVAKFDNLYKVSPNNCVGNVLAHKIYDLKTIKKLPINVFYADSIESPNEPNQAKQLLQKHNAEILIYGIYRNNTTICDSGSVCFKTASNNLLNYIAKSKEVNIDNYNKEYKPFNSYDVDNGVFTLDTLSFDNWIQSLYILKQRGNLYNKYVALYSISKQLTHIGKAQKFLERSLLNHQIENYYDAIADIDTAISLLKIDYESKESLALSKIKTGTEFFEHFLKYQNYNEKIKLLKSRKYILYTFFNEPKIVIKMIDTDIRTAKKGLRTSINLNGDTLSSEMSIGFVPYGIPLKEKPIIRENNLIKGSKDQNTYSFDEIMRPTFKSMSKGSIHFVFFLNQIYLIYML